MPIVARLDLCICVLRFCLGNVCIHFVNYCLPQEAIATGEDHVRIHDRYESCHGQCIQWLSDLERRFGQYVDGQNGDLSIIKDSRMKLEASYHVYLYEINAYKVDK